METTYDDNGGSGEGRRFSVRPRKQRNKGNEGPALQTLNIYNCAKSARKRRSEAENLFRRTKHSKSTASLVPRP